MNPKLTQNTVITGAEFRDFYQNHWPGPDWYIDDVAFEFEDELGKYTLPDDARVKLGDCGYLVWQGKNGDPHKTGEMFPFFDFYVAYKAKRDTEFVVAQVPVGRLKEAMEFLSGIGATVTVGSGTERLSDEQPKAPGLGRP